MNERPTTGDSDERRIRGLLDEDRPTSQRHDDDVISASLASAARIRARRSDQPVRRRMSVWIPAALAAGIAVVVLVLPLGVEPPMDDTFRSDNGVIDTLPLHRAELDMPPTRFTWPSQSGAAGYVVKLRDQTGGLVWTSAVLTTTSVEPPDDVIASLGPGGSFLWTVSVRGSVAQSELGPYAFSVSR